jgi:hypothetical protein
VGDTAWAAARGAHCDEGRGEQQVAEVQHVALRGVGPAPKPLHLSSALAMLRALQLGNSGRAHLHIVRGGGGAAGALEPARRRRRHLAPRRSGVYTILRKHYAWNGTAAGKGRRRDGQTRWRCRTYPVAVPNLCRKVRELTREGSSTPGHARARLSDARIIFFTDKHE